MNHKYSTYAVLFFIFLLIGGAIYALTSSEMDEICDQNNSIMWRNETLWQCMNLTNISGGSVIFNFSGNITGTGTPSMLSVWVTNSSLGDSNISWTGSEWDFDTAGIQVNQITSNGLGGHYIIWDFLYMFDYTVSSIVTPLILDGSEDVYIQRNGAHLANFSDGEINFNGLKSGEGVVVISSLDDAGTLVFANAQAEEYYACDGGSFFHFGLGNTCQALDVYRIEKSTGHVNITEFVTINDTLTVTENVTAANGVYVTNVGVEIGTGNLSIIKGRIRQTASSGGVANHFADGLNTTGGVNTTKLRATGAVTLLSTLTATSAASSFQAVTASSTLVVTGLTTLNGGLRVSGSTNTTRLSVNSTALLNDGATAAQGFNTTNLKSNGTVNFTSNTIYMNLGATSGYVCYNATTQKINISAILCPI